MTCYVDFLGKFIAGSTRICGAENLEKVFEPPGGVLLLRRTHRLSTLWSKYIDYLFGSE